MEGDLVKKIGDLGLYVVDGDITQIPTEAIITAINSEGLWFGGIDGAINRAAGDKYHHQAQCAMPLKDLQTIVAKGFKEDHNGQFNDVVFVVDDLKSPVNEVVYAGLTAAHNEEYGKVAIPAIRMGLMAGTVEKTPEETVNKLGKGILDFMNDYGNNTCLNEIKFVVYRDPSTESKLKSGLYVLPPISEN